MRIINKLTFKLTAGRVPLGRADTELCTPTPLTSCLTVKIAVTVLFILILKDLTLSLITFSFLNKEFLFAIT